MKTNLTTKLASAAAAFALTFSLVACGGGPRPSTFKQETLPEADGIKVTSENAAANSSATTQGAFTVAEGDLVVVSPDVSKGSFHLTITSTDGSKTVYDDNANGHVMFNVNAETGTYDVKTTAYQGTTGTMTVFSMKKSEQDAQNDALEDALAKENIEAKDVMPETK